MRRKKREDIRKSIVILILATFALLALFLLVQPRQRKLVEKMTTESSEDLFFYYQTTRYPSFVEIAKKQEGGNILIGLAVDPWNLNFGIVQIGNVGRRFIELFNNQDDDVKVMLETYGNISSMVKFDKNNFILSKSTNSTVTIELQSTEKTMPGNYTGKIDVIIKKPKYNFAYIFL